MTRNKDQKRLIRSRMRKTGESYTSARAQILSKLPAHAPRLSAAALQAMNQAIQAGDSIAVATITLVETVYLAEKGRVLRQSLALLLRALRDPGSGFTPVDLDSEVARTVRRVARAQVPDMPDRIIAATAVRSRSKYSDRSFQVW